MKAIIIFITLLFVTRAGAQLRVDAAGNVGIGTTWPNPANKLDIRGNLLLTDYPTTPEHSLNLRLNVGFAGPTLSTVNDQMFFWSEWVAFHDLYAANYFKISDAKYKSNIKTVTNGIEMVRKLRPVSYTIVDNKYDENGKETEGSSTQIGFIAQEIKAGFPEFDITAMAKEDLLMDYDQLIPVSIAAIQEQQEMIEALKNEISLLKEQVNSLTSTGQNGNTDREPKKQSYLKQNVPNPFNGRTEINYFISDENFQDASIIIFDLNGTLIEKQDIRAHGKGQITIEANRLKAGMYIYSLVVNQKEIDSKRMILLD